MADANERTIPSLSPHLVVSDAAAAIDFYKKAFNATELSRHLAPDGKRIMHAAVLINGATVMLNDDFPEYSGGKRSTPDALGGTPVVLHLHMQDADAFFEHAAAAGAEVKIPLADQFWGDRYGQLKDPFGHVWSIGATKQKLSEEELKEAAKAHFQ
jgi:PhnB protein